MWTWEPARTKNFLWVLFTDSTLSICLVLDICNHLSCLVHTVFWDKQNFKILLKFCMLQRKNMQGFNQGGKPVSIQLNLYTVLHSCSWRVLKSLFYFCSPNGVHVTCVCLHCGRRKQNFAISSIKPPSYICIYTSDYRTETIPSLICVNNLNQL